MGKPLCLHFIPSLEQGGAERLLVDLTIADDRFQHAIITILSGVHFFTGAVNAPVRSIGGGSRRWTPLLAPIILVRACLALWRLKPQVVVGWLYYGNRELGALVGGLGLRDEVEALGAIDGIADFYRRIDVLTLSSSYGESMPLVLIEALASGCPVVATDIGSCRQIVGGFGRVVPPQAPVELASAVLEVAALGRDPAWRRAASDHVEQHFSLNRFIDEWNTLVALSRPAAPAAA